MGKPKQLEIIYKHGVPKIYLSGKTTQNCFKNEQQILQNTECQKRSVKGKLELRVPKRRILWGEVRNRFKKKSGILKNANQRKELSDRIKTKLG